VFWLTVDPAVDVEFPFVAEVLEIGWLIPEVSER
jgi:hypothetical protein